MVQRTRLSSRNPGCSFAGALVSAAGEETAAAALAVAARTARRRPGGTRALAAPLRRQVLRQLPQGIVPPSYQKSNPADAPILYLALTSDQLPLSAIDEYAQTFLAQRISTVAGVAQVNVFGSQKFAVRVQAEAPSATASGS